MGDGFQRMADGVAEVEHGAVVLFALVRFDDSGLDGAASGDGLNQQAAIQLQQFFDLRFE